MTEELFDDELGRLWRSAPTAATGTLAARALALRRRAMRRAAAETVGTIALLFVLARQVATTVEPAHTALIGALTAALIFTQICLILVRRREWRHIGDSPEAYWGVVADKARLGLRVARGSSLAGPSCLLLGTLLIFTTGGFAPPSPGTIAWIAGACVAIVIVALREAGRQRRDLREAEAILVELQG